MLSQLRTRDGTAGWLSTQSSHVLARLFKRIQSICENPGPSLIFFDFERPEPVDELLEETPAERGNLLVPLTVTLILFEELVDREAMAQRERERGQRGRRERGLERVVLLG